MNNSNQKYDIVEKEISIQKRNPIKTIQKVKELGRRVYLSMEKKRGPKKMGPYLGKEGKGP